MGNLDLLKVSLPVKMFEPRSYLQKLTDPWVYPRFLQLAAQSKDPVERLQWVVTYFIAGFHRAFTRWAKPFNPILGETWQATAADGSRIYLEQISHHPPISAFQLLGPHGMYTFCGQSQPSVSYKTNAVRTTARGYRVIDFADGGRIEVHFPAYYLKGLLYTSAPRGELTGTAEFVDAANGLQAVVTFGPVEGARSSVLWRPDAFSGSIYLQQPRAPLERQASGGVADSGWVMPTGGDKAKRSASSFSSIGSMMRTGLGGLGLRSKSSPAVAEEATGRDVVASCSGNWLSHLDWGSDRWWTLLEEAAVEWEPVPHPLPSDCRYRDDLAALAAGDVKAAQAAKEALEQRQRADAKLRKAGGGSG
ncbi:Oxysterol-binding 9 [Chlorella sorokiniana]|uniref:Oxysterol-binding 9 n=1 Tax=Chlorella sorokiniana TaxID=3076 RepID=A0A2P6U0U6_CHLSO|nr:Oxysterol-binding 9 [Chlorella sorokiniana]|eukprot:PRW59937.1 Oxysterol-binding 9 [Chlorella sorokiniana]